MRPLALLVVAACQSREDAPPTPPPPPPVYTSAGVPAGGIVRDAKEGPSAYVATIDGDVAVRRCGELASTPATAREPLWGCDELRTGEHAAATLVLADTTTIEVAEDSALAIGSRYAQVDASSTVALLFGVARFVVPPRAPGEGLFFAFTPASFVVVGLDTKGATFGLGVAVDGRGRLAVDDGDARAEGKFVSGTGYATEVAQDLDATPGPIDWGAWRVAADARADLATAFVEHGRQLLHLEDNLADAYKDLRRIADRLAGELAGASEVSARTWTWTWIEASYATALRIEVLTWQFASRAALAHEIYARDPELAAKVPALAARVDAAIVWPKRYEATAAAFLAPIRIAHYVLDQDGRSIANAVGIAIPQALSHDLYVASSTTGSEEIRKRTETPVWVLDAPRAVAQPRVVWPLDPPAHWSFAPPRTKPWYTRHDRLATPVIVGVPAKTHVLSHLDLQPAQTRDQLVAMWPVPVRSFHVQEPDMALEQRTRAKLKLEDGRIPNY